MTTTVCPGCKDRPVAAGRYMCIECEDRMAGRPPRSGQGASSNSSSRCGKCGTTLNADDSFCPSCGSPRPSGASGRPSSARAPREDQTYQDPLFVNGVYRCPKCNAALGAGTRRCGACGVMFMNPVPQAGDHFSSGGSTPRSDSAHPTPFCHKCGTAQDPEDTFCSSCGAVQCHSQWGSSQAKGPAPTATAPVKSRVPIIAGASLAVVFTLTALVALIMFIWTQHQAIVAQKLADQAKHQRALAQQKAQEEEARWAKNIAAIYRPPTNQQLQQSQPAAGDVFQTDTTVDPDSDPTQTMRKQYQNSRWSNPRSAPGIGTTPFAASHTPDPTGAPSTNQTSAPSADSTADQQPYTPMQTPKLFFPNDSVSHELGK
jgi:heme exporter protein D